MQLDSSNDGIMIALGEMALELLMELLEGARGAQGRGVVRDKFYFAHPFKIEYYKCMYL